MEEELNKLKALVVEWVKACDAFDAVTPGNMDDWEKGEKVWDEAQNKLMAAGREYMKEGT